MSRRHAKAHPCPTATKAAYSTEEHADAALAWIAALPAFEFEGTKPTRHYRCACGAWHLTSRSTSYAEIGERMKAASEAARSYLPAPGRITDAEA